MHLDFGPDVAGGALFPFLEAFTDMRTGISIARGGASRLIDALVAAAARRPAASCARGAEVARVAVAAGRASGVELAGGERIAARRAVIAGLTPTALYGRLLEPAAAPPRAARRGGRATPTGRATMMVHLALSRPGPVARGR